MTSQVKSRYKRWLNVDNEYQLIKLKNDRRILLIDVVTTGATINSCLNAIQNNEFKITVAALAGINLLRFFFWVSTEASISTFLTAHL